MLIQIFLLILISSAISYLTTPFVLTVATKYGLVDNPKKRHHPAHTHQGTIPRAGGLPIFLGIFLPLIFILPVNSQITGIVVAISILLITGLWDDKSDRSPYIRLISNIVAASVVIGVGINVPYITNPFGGILHLDGVIIPLKVLGYELNINIFANLIALIWIVWTMNIVGWSGGIDGQLPGFVAISAIIIGILSLRFASNDPTQFQVTFLSFITAGSFIGFLPWNFYPQKIMPGYGGKTIAGFMLAIISILSFSKLGTALLVLAVPMTDATFMLVKRIFSGKSPVWASSGHLHHHLLSLGWGKRKIALFYWTISAFAGTAALFLNSRQKIFVGVLIFVVIAGFLLGVNFLIKYKTKSID